MEFLPEVKEEKFGKLPVVSVHLDEDYCLISDEQIYNVEEAIELVADRIEDCTEEKAYAIFMDDALCPICAASVGSGNTRNVTFSIRNIVQTAILSNATYVTILHNHPARNVNNRQCCPSKDDVIVTYNVLKALAYFDVELFDSIIVCGFKKNKLGKENPVYYSMKEHNFAKLTKKYGIKHAPLPLTEYDIEWNKDKVNGTDGNVLSDRCKQSEDISYKFGFLKGMNTPDFDLVKELRKALDPSEKEKWYKMSDHTKQKLAEL